MKRFEFNKTAIAAILLFISVGGILFYLYTNYYQKYYHQSELLVNDDTKLIYLYRATGAIDKDLTDRKLILLKHTDHPCWNSTSFRTKKHLRLYGCNYETFILPTRLSASNNMDVYVYEENGQETTYVKIVGENNTYLLKGDKAQDAKMFLLVQVKTNLQENSFYIADVTQTRNYGMTSFNEIKSLEQLQKHPTLHWEQTEEIYTVEAGEYMGTISTQEKSP